MRRTTRAILALSLAALLWLPAVHALFAEDADEPGRARTREALLRAQLALLEEPSSRAASLARMRGANAEWDFMSRTFLVLALANHALDRPAERARALRAIDRLLEETVALELEAGQAHFLMPYVHAGRFRDPSGRSVFVDGEIALMMAARQRVEASERWREPLARRIESIRAQMERGPVLSAESYPDECWTFCNTIALAAIRLGDSVRGEDHGALLRRWVRVARDRLLDPATGMLVSSYTLDGEPLDGPEGSSVFLAAHMLQIVDPAFAREQYERARAHLGVSVLGFGWAREWPEGRVGPADVDSGPIVPLVGASPGASGMALVGAAAFDDRAWLEALHTSLAFAAFPEREGGALRYRASNQVGDAVLLYSMTAGPLFRSVGPPPPPRAAARGGRS